MVKLIVCAKRKPGMGVEEFHHYWRTTHGELIKSIPGLRKYIRRYVQCHTIPQAYARHAAPFDGAAELWFDNLEAVDAFLADPEYLAKVRPDELKFTDHPNLVWFVTQEEPVIEG